MHTLAGVGSTCLGVAKYFIQNFYYNYICNRFPQHNVHYSDTDSITVSIRGVEDIYEVMKADGHLFDMSGYDPNHPTWSRFHDSTNKKRPGFFKDEYANAVIRRFITIKPKMYAVEYVKSWHENGEEQTTIGTDRKAKGVPKVSIKRDCKFENYVQCLEGNRQTFAESTGIRSFKSKLYTVNIRKSAFSAFDAKRWISPCGVMTLAYGNPLIKVYEQNISVNNEPTEYDNMTDSQLVNHLIDI